MAGKIFISYRREDVAANALGICQYLEHEFGRKNVFIDVDMQAGEKFPAVLEQRLTECTVMLVLIGPNWIRARDDHGKRRLENPDDWVRLEIAHALKRAIKVIPVRVNGGELPKKTELPEDIQGLLDHQAASVNNTSFRSEMAGLVRDIRSKPNRTSLRLAGAGVASVVLLLLIACVVAFSGVLHRKQTTDISPQDPFPNPEWTFYQIAHKRFAQYLKLSSIKIMGDSVAGLTRYAVEPGTISIPGKTFSEDDYAEDLIVTDCKGPLIALSEQTIVSRTGEIKYHHKWGDPELVLMSTGLKVASNSVFETLLNIFCHKELRTPLAQKQELVSVNFSYLSSTPSGGGEVFYKSSNSDTHSENPDDPILVIRENEDHNLHNDVFPGLFIIGLPHSYRTIVQQVRFDCTAPKVTILKTEYYNSSNNLVYLAAAKAPSPADVIRTSPVDLLRRIVCKLANEPPPNDNPPIDISGAWKIETQNGPSPVCAFKQAGTNLTGSCTGPKATGAITGTIVGKQVRWAWQWSTYADDAAAAFDFVGSLAPDDAINGKLERRDIGLLLDFKATKQ